MENLESEKVVFVIENRELICDKTNLMANSEYFRTMFSGNFVEKQLNKIELKEVEYKTMETLEKCLWDLEVVDCLDMELLLKIYKASNMFLINHLKEFCVNLMIKQLSATNCIQIWLLGQLYQDDELVKRAKFLSILEFDLIRNSDQIFLFEFDTLLQYLSNKYLQCSDELNVFETGILWFKLMYRKFVKENNEEEILLKLLFCLDFNSLTDDKIDEILKNNIIIVHDRITNILNCVKCLKNSKDTDGFDGNCLKFSKQLLESKSRNFDGSPCFLANKNYNHNRNQSVAYLDAYRRKRKSIIINDTNDKRFKNNNDNKLVIIYLDQSTNELKKLLEIDANFNVEGFNIISYRQFIYIFGGEEIIGKGPWKERGWKYDSIHNTGTYFDFPYKRRHFECCIVNNYLFIIGGYGRYRIYEYNLFYYDLINDKWSNLINLPYENRNIKCCSYRNQLFLLDIDRGFGYLYEPNLIGKPSWRCYKITNLLINLETIRHNSLFCYNNQLYLSDDNGHLIEIILENSRIHLDYSSTNTSFTWLEKNFILCYDNLYNLIDNSRYLNLSICNGSPLCQLKISFNEFSLKQRNLKGIFCYDIGELFPVKITDDQIEYCRMRSTVHLFKALIIDQIDERINQFPQ